MRRLWEVFELGMNCKVFRHKSLKRTSFAKKAGEAREKSECCSFFFEADSPPANLSRSFCRPSVTRTPSPIRAFSLTSHALLLKTLRPMPFSRRKVFTQDAARTFPSDCERRTSCRHLRLPVEFPTSFLPPTGLPEGGWEH